MKRRADSEAGPSTGATAVEDKVLEEEVDEEEEDEPETKIESTQIIPAPSSSIAANTQLAKRQRMEDKQLIQSGPKRTSNLTAPIMLLTGHEAAIYSCKFSPCGRYLASGSFDRNILLWNVYDECTNFHLLKGHSGAVLDLTWSRDGINVLSVGSDKSVMLWDAMVGTRVKKFRGHTSIVNSCSKNRRGDQLYCTGSDDGTVRLWDNRKREAIDTLPYKYQVTAVAFNEGGDQIFSGSIDNKIAVWDLRKRAISYHLTGHMDTITGLSLSPDGSTLLSNSMDNTLRTWDVKPFAANNRLLKVFEGAPHGIEKNLLKCSWSADGTKIGAGSADRTVNIWDVSGGNLIYKLTGHKGCVNDVDLHPKEQIVLSGSSDKTMYLGELDIKY